MAAGDGASQLPPEWDARQEKLVLSVCPGGSRVAAVASCQPGYRAYPMQVQIALPDGATRTLSLQAYEDQSVAEREATVLAALATLGLPVQETLAGPMLPAQPLGAPALVVRSWLPGNALPAYDVSAWEIDLTCRLTIEAVRWLHEQTGPVERHPAFAALSRKTLPAELDAAVTRGGPWLKVPLVAEAIQRLPAALAAVEVPLVFSNGDYNPLNFLTDGRRLTGMVDFVGACFEDPHIGFAKFVLWSGDRGWAPFSYGGLVERWVYEHNVSRTQFAPRLAVEALRMLQQGIPLCGESGYRQHVLGLLEQSVKDLPRG